LAADLLRLLPSLLQTLLVSTPSNIDPIHVPGEDLLAMIKVQQHVLTHLHLKLPLLNGMFVLVPTAQLAPGNGSSTSTSSSLNCHSCRHPLAAAPDISCGGAAWRRPCRRDSGAGGG
jgi:hypothetical protein